MQFRLASKTSLPLDPQLLYTWYSNNGLAVIACDDRAAFALPIAGGPPTPFPLPALNNEFLLQPHHGFRLLPPTASTSLDLLRTLIFGPNYNYPLLHPASNLILRLNSGSMELLTASLTSIAKTRTRGKPTLAFAAHPTQNFIVYGDNFGTFYAHHFNASGFQKAAKIAAKERHASRVEFSPDGTRLILAGMGYLCLYSAANNKFTLLHEISTAVRDFLWHDNLLLVNQGLHGLTAYRPSPTGFTQLATLHPDDPLNQITLSADGTILALSFQDSATVCIYGLSP